MRLIIREDAHKASTYVAQYIVDRITAFNPTAENPFVLGLPTGSSPMGVYKILVERYKAGQVRHLHQLNLDQGSQSLDLF
jgi:glucosamine-6-phosphate deaminase